jgi:hypothetical protein
MSLNSADDQNFYEIEEVSNQRNKKISFGINGAGSLS